MATLPRCGRSEAMAPGPNIVALELEGRALVAVINGEEPQPFEPSAADDILPAGGGLVLAAAQIWKARNNLEESERPWADSGELGVFLEALHGAGYEARTVSEQRARKICKSARGARHDPAKLAAYAHDAVAVSGEGALWCGSWDHHESFGEGSVVLAAAGSSELGVATFTPTARYHQDERPTVAFDWSLKGVHATGDGVRVERHDNIGELVASLEVPTKLVAETTFESWDPGQRSAVVAEVRERGHELYVYRPLHTSRRRPAGLPKTDANDARVIYSIAVDGRFHLYPAPGAPNINWARRQMRANREYQRIRLAEQKPQLAAEAEAILGPYSELESEPREVLGNGQNYSTTLLAVTLFATKWSRSRNEFERLLGLSGAGYPALLRSEIHTHVWRHADARGVTHPQFRRVLRRVRRTFLEAGVSPVEEHSVLPGPDELAEALADAGFPITAEAAARAAQAIAAQAR